MNFANSKILVVGDVMLDRYWWGSVDRISPEAPVPVVRLENTSLVAGGAANVAANLKGLGVTPCLFGVVGEDEEAKLLEKKLDENGISANYLSRIAARPTTIKTRIVAHNQHVVRIDQETAEPVSDTAADEIVDRIKLILPDIDAAIISDYAKGFLTDHLLKCLIDELRSYGKMILVDPKRRDLSSYSGATVVTPNKREAAEAAGIDLDSPEMVKEAGKKLLSEIDLKALLITEGEHGMTLFEPGREICHLEPLAHQVFDVTGAGDTVIATFAAALADGKCYEDAAKLANIAAGIVVGRIGTTTITSTMIEEYLKGTEVSEETVSAR